MSSSRDQGRALERRFRRPAADMAACACAASAGIHAALVPEHLREAAPLGAAFGLAAVLLAAAAVMLILRPATPRAAQAAALLLAALIVSWAAAAITGLPVVQPRPEPVDAVGPVTKLIEAVGLVCAIWLSQPAGGRRSSAV